MIEELLAFTIAADLRRRGERWNAQPTSWFKAPSAGTRPGTTATALRSALSGRTSRQTAITGGR